MRATAEQGKEQEETTSFFLQYIFCINLYIDCYAMFFGLLPKLPAHIRFIYVVSLRDDLYNLFKKTKKEVTCTFAIFLPHPLLSELFVQLCSMDKAGHIRRFNLGFYLFAK